MSVELVGGFVQALLLLGADPTWEDAKGQTPLLVASTKGNRHNQEAIEEMIKAAVEVPRIPTDSPGVIKRKSSWLRQATSTVSHIR